MDKSKYHILFKVTSRERPERLRRCLDHLYKNLSLNKNYSVIVTLDLDDPALDLTVPMLKHPNLKYIIAHGENKIQAINRDIPNECWDILVNVSDDQYFTIAAFDEAIRNQFDNLDTVLHLPDDNREDLMTMSVIGYQYYQRDGYVYHPSYQGQFCDDEAMQVAVQRGCLKKYNHVLFTHAHPNYGKAYRDGLYRRYDALFQEDKRNFDNRKLQNFPR